MAVIDTFVCVDDEHIYPALVDPANRWKGSYVSPGFTIDTVRQLAEHTEEMAQKEGRKVTEQIKVIEGGPVPVVLHIRWPYLGEDPSRSVDVVEPDADGRYWIGGWEWCWDIVEDPLLFHSKRAALDAWCGMLNATARRVGEVVRTQLPDAVAATVDLRGLGHIQAVTAASGANWPNGDERDGDDGYGPFDTETLGEADELIREALDFGLDRRVEMGGWRRARDIGPDMHRIVFGPQGTEAAGDGPLKEARERLIEARRQLLTDLVPRLATVCREAAPDVIGVVASRTDPQGLLWLVSSDDAPTQDIRVPSDKVQAITERLLDSFAYAPTNEDLAACGWQPVPGHEDIDAHRLMFPAE